MRREREGRSPRLTTVQVLVVRLRTRELQSLRVDLNGSCPVERSVGKRVSGVLLLLILLRVRSLVGLGCDGRARRVTSLGVDRSVQEDCGLEFVAEEGRDHWSETAEKDKRRKN
jgi:hypothetical protein